MADFGQFVQKAFYLGVGIASYASEKAGDGFVDLRQQAQKLVDELVERGAITAEEAQNMVNDMVDKAQQSAGAPVDNGPPTDTAPRTIEIIEDDQPDDRAATDALRKEIEDLQTELQRLKDEDNK